MMRSTVGTVILALGCISLQAFAQVSVADAWTRATVPAQKASGAFMELTSKSEARLVEVKSPIASVVEIHEMAMDKDVMVMRALPNGLPLPAGKTVELKPGGFHVMLMNLKEPIKEGQAVPLTLILEEKGGKRSQLDVTAVARPLGAPAQTKGHEHHGKH